MENAEINRGSRSGEGGVGGDGAGEGGTESGVNGMNGVMGGVGQIGGANFNGGGMNGIGSGILGGRSSKGRGSGGVKWVVMVGVIGVAMVGVLVAGMEIGKNMNKKQGGGEVVKESQEEKREDGKKNEQQNQDSGEKPGENEGGQDETAKKMKAMADAVDRYQGSALGTTRELKIEKEEGNFVQIWVPGGGGYLMKTENGYVALDVGQILAPEKRAEMLNKGMSEEFLYGKEEDRLKEAYIRYYARREQGGKIVDTEEMKKRKGEIDIIVSKRDGNFLSAGIRPKGDIGGAAAVFSKNNPQREYVCLTAGHMIPDDEQVILDREGVPKHLYMSSGR